MTTAAASVAAQETISARSLCITGCRCLEIGVDACVVSRLPRQVHHIRLMDRLIPPLLLKLWREQHPEGREQITLDFEKREQQARAVPLFTKQRKGEDDEIPVRRNRYEIEPRPAALGGVWRLRLFGQDPETGEDIEMGGGVFPGESSEDFGEVYDAHADAMQGGQGLAAEPGGLGARPTFRRAITASCVWKSATLPLPI